MLGDNFMKTLLTLTLALAMLAIGSALLTSSTKAINLDQVPNHTSVSPQVIEICKKTIPAGGTGFQFSWANGAGALPSFSLDDSQCTTRNMTGQDHYNTFTENVPAGWSLTNITCNATTTPVKIIGANPNHAFQAGDNTVTMDLNEPKVTCTFHNRRQPRCCRWSLDLSTGQGTGSIDPLWQVNNSNAYTISNLGVLSGTWLGLPPARWVQPANSSTPKSASGGPYKYKIKFAVPACEGPVLLTGSFAADNSATAYLDNVAIPGASCPGPTCFNQTQAPVSLNGAPLITSGSSHLLEIHVQNASASFSGLVVNARVTRVCR